MLTCHFNMSRVYVILNTSRMKGVSLHETGMSGRAAMIVSLDIDSEEIEWNKEIL